MSKQVNRLLIVDHAEAWSGQFSRLGRRMGYSTETAGNLAEFRDALEQFMPTVVLIDLTSVENDGLGYLKALREPGSDSQLMLIADAETRALGTATRLAEVLGLAVVASTRSPATLSVVRNELRKAKQSLHGATLGGLREALERGDVRPCYRPKVRYRERRGWSVTEVEALVRWHMDDTNVVMPEDFYPLAEQGGLMPAITKGLLRCVVEQMREWQDRRQPLGVCVGLPDAALADESLSGFLVELVREAKIEPSALTLEVAEALTMSCSAPARETLRRLKAAGFRLGIEEFGSSYLSLEGLCRHRFDELRIDSSLVQESRVSAEVRMILEATVAFAHKLGLSVCADGVDSERALQYLARIGCDKAQGDFIGRPLSPQALQTVLRQWNVPAIAC